MRVGDPLDPNTRIGAIVNEAQMGRIERYLRTATDQGAKIGLGGHGLKTGAGLFMQPTLVTGVTPSMTVAREEIFGPVLSVITFDTLEEAIGIANDTHYGLSAGIWTERYTAALKAGRELSAGTVWVNIWMDGFPEMPFGGMRQSGVGREQGPDAINEFTETKSVLLHQGPHRLWVPDAKMAERG